MNSKILLILLFFCASFYQTVAQAPPNDDCTGAIAISTVPFGTACSTSVSTSTLPVSVTSAGLRLFNGSGGLVKQLSGQPISNGVYTLDMQDQPAGIYFLHVNTGRNWHQLKVIKR